MSMYQNSALDQMGPPAPRPPKHLMTILATLMLNKRLQQRRAQTVDPMMQQQASPQGNRMAELARMQLNMGSRQGPTY